MREHLGQGKKTTTVSIPTLKQPTRGFGLESPEASPQTVTETELLDKPPGHDISKISLRPQAKLSISQPGDFYEQQADNIAQQVMRRIAQPARQYVQPQQMPEEEDKLQMKPLANSITPVMQRQQAPQEEEEEQLQMKSLASSSTSWLQRQQAPQEEELQMKPMVQRRPSGAEKTAASDLETSIQQSRGSGQPLADDIKQPMEQAFGADFGGVRIHTSAKSDSLNKSIQARAFTTGQDIFFRQGEYSPGSNSGKELLAHELTHVIQQNSSSLQPKSLHIAPKENKVQTKYIAESGQAIQMRESPQKPTEGNTEQKTDEVKVKTDTEEGKQQNQNPTQKQQTASPPPADEGNAGTDPPPTKKDDATVASSQTKSATKKQAEEHPQKQPEPKDDTSGKQAPKNQENKQVSKETNNQEVAPQAQDKDKPELPKAATGLPGVKANQAAGNLPASNVASNTGTIPETAVGGEAIADNGEKAPASPEEDPAFQGVVNTTKEVAHQEKKHAPADKKAGEAQAAAEPPGNEVDSKAQANQVGEMGQAETPAFDAAAFKAKLMQRIADMAPKTLEDADNFKNNNQLDSVKGELSGQVKEEQKATQEPLEEKTKEKPDTSGIEAKQVTPLPNTEPGTPPSGVGAEQAAPKSKGQGEVEAPLQVDSQHLEQQMSQADVSEEQLAKSNEPQFQEALAVKKDAQTNAVEAPPKYRQQEQAILATAQATAETTAKQHLDAMHNTRNQNLGQVADHQVGAKGKDEQARAKVAGDINKIYEKTKVKVEKTLSELDGQVIQAFDSGAAEAKKAFEDYVGKRMDDYKSDRYSGILGPAKWLGDKLFGMPSEVNAFYEEGRNLYIKQMDGVINNVVAIISKGLTQAKAEIASGKQEIQNYVNKLPQDLKGVGQQAAADIESKFAELQQTVDSKQDELIDTLAQKYKENLDAVDARIEEMKAANKGLVQKALDFIVGVIKTIIELTKMLLQVLARVAGVVGQILKDPIGFLSNLIQAVKQGFLNFMKNIGKHLQAGLIGWLTGTMAASGLQIPENLDIKGIFSLAMQLLGFTYEVIRAQAVKRLGEKKVSRMEQSVEVFRVLASQGIAGMWQFVQDRIGDLNTLVIEPIKNFVIEKVITAGIEWILSLLTPASAFIKAAKAIYEIVKFFIERAAQIADLINAILDAIGAIASGSIDQAIKGVENALAKSLPVVISFLASLLGLGGIAGKIQAIFQKLRKPMEKAVDWIIDKGAKAFKKIGNKFNNSKVGNKFNAAKDAPKEKYKAGKQWVEDKKEAGQKWVNDKKQAAEQWVSDKKQSVKNKFNKSKLGQKFESAKAWGSKKKQAAKKWVEDKKKALKDKYNKTVNKGKEKLAAIIEWWKVKKNFKAQDGEKHTIFFKGKAENAKLCVASEPIEISNFLNKKKKEIKKITDVKSQKEQNKYIQEAEQLNTQIEKQKDALIKSNKGKPASKKSKSYDENKKLYGDLTQNINTMAGIVKNLFIPNAQEFPPAIMPPFSDNVKAKSIKAEFISKGSFPPGQDSNQHSGNLAGWDALQAQGMTKNAAWVKMHLLTEQLGGMATDSNLTPAKTQTNSKFYRTAEKSAINAVNQGKMIWYKVDIAYHSSPNEDYISYVKATWGEYQVNQANKWEAQPASSEKFEEAPQPPDFTQTTVIELNSSDGRVQIENIIGVRQSFARKVVYVREADGKFKNLVDFNLKMNARKTKRDANKFDEDMNKIKDAHNNKKIKFS
ncbi:DUF4157 domain-containing protein [Nostoc sp. FACHB-152]|uniref:eCIS core domain-containing protein n=1 Tax=unclassified Nostoc TaxID=2593658 RepID=UPI0016883034|nr:MULTISPECIES: DUF4157 domain-containing protein [unclassified Nostoc]MBD2449265.1 DUF4157 domain-containing protein [Nostoc sp. FACHB-152]MBD2470457.1 DUF4157 domain-containing protein [Nostoc sp. FACHB-145]